MLSRVALILVLLWAAPAFAQQSGTDAQSPLPRPPAAENRFMDGPLAQADEDSEPPMPPSQRRRMDRIADRGRQIERLRTRKLLEVLDLSPDQQKAFLKSFREMRRERIRIEMEQHQLVAQLADLVRDDRPDTKAIEQLIAQREKLEQLRFQLLRDFVSSVRRQLTPIQVAKLIVFEDRFEMEMLQKMRDFRMHRMDMPPGQPGGPRGPRAPMPDSEESGE